MLTHLTIRDIVLIDQLQIGFEPGLTVLTGETGAGKSILLDALALATGARGDGGLVRAGQEKGSITASFDLPADHPVFGQLADNDIDSDGELILRRVQSADGRTRAFVNDQPVSATLLREVGSGLIEIHGQHDDRALVDSSTHRILLDAFGELEAEAEFVADSYVQWNDLVRRMAELKQKVAEADREAEYLRAAVNELQKLSPMPGEENDLAESRQIMMQAEKVAGDISEGHEALAGTQSPVPVIAGLLRRLERKSEQVPGLLDETLATLDRTLVALDESTQALETALRQTEFDPQRLEETEERLFALRAASRKFHVPVDQLPELAIKMKDDLDALDNSAENLAMLEAQVEIAKDAFDRAAQKLSEERHRISTELERIVADELPALKLENARFIVSIETDSTKPSSHGIDQISFWVQTNPGTRPGPMIKVASGGELSRFLLALKVSLADKGSAPCLIFDEIDTGVGGAVAEAIGRRLARLAERVQVLSVTHAPQVAARATGHLLIEKAALSAEDRVKTAVRNISEQARTEEIARMLAGATITAEARAAAEKLMTDGSNQ